MREGVRERKEINLKIAHSKIIIAALCSKCTKKVKFFHSLNKNATKLNFFAKTLDFMHNGVYNCVITTKTEKIRKGEKL